MEKSLLKAVATKPDLKYKMLCWCIIKSSGRLIFISTIVAVWYFTSTDFTLTWNLLLFFPIALIFNANLLYSSVLKGEGKHVLSSFFENTSYFSLSLIFVFLFFYFKGVIEIADIIFSHFISSLFISSLYIFKFFRLYRNDMQSFGELHNPVFGRISVIGNLNKFIPILILSMYVDLSSVSTFKVSEQLAFSSGFILLVVNAVYSSAFVKLSNSGDTVGLFSSFKKAMLFSVLTGAASVILIFSFSDFLFSYTNIKQGSYEICFLILLLAAFINLAAGPVFTFLTMTGLEKSVEKIMLLSVIVSFVLLPVSYFYQSVEIVSFIVLVASVIQNAGALIVVKKRWEDAQRLNN
ncbi:hypothetical protein WCN91_01980 [Pseudoalteromonas sp. YIC-827]|uniref:Membrane protein involved in the export of O-antigen and teichoic acid n=1 Tax=Pseudoalteromonas qingdaonensis TaxID=3131913 RepID=A0ABU9MV84_9GAMM